VGALSFPTCTNCQRQFHIMLSPTCAFRAPKRLTHLFAKSVPDSKSWGPQREQRLSTQITLPVTGRFPFPAYSPPGKRKRETFPFGCSSSRDRRASPCRCRNKSDKSIRLSSHRLQFTLNLPHAPHRRLFSVPEVTRGQVLVLPTQCAMKLDLNLPHAHALKFHRFS